MIDIHSHILWNLDDGARDFDESVQMLRVAVDSGTSDIVATPHANLCYTFDPASVNERIQRLSGKIDSIRIHRGCDFHFYTDNINDALANPSRYTINGRSYLLVEFSDLLIFQNTGEVFDEMLAAQMVPVITHPERNSLLYSRTADLAAWAARGVCLQVTAQSLLGRFGRDARDFAHELIERGLVAFLASDAHDCIDRPPRLDLGYRHLAERYAERVARALCIENPRAVLAGDPLPMPPEPVKSNRRWWFW